MIGTPESAPIRLAPKPSWNTATTTPYAAATDSRLKSAETSGIHSERNTTTSRSTDRPITIAMKSGSRLETLSEMSSNAALLPPTYTLSGVSAIARGMTSARRRSSRSEVRASCGAVAGIAKIVAISPSSLSVAAGTEAMPGVLATACWSAVSCARSPERSSACRSRGGTARWCRDRTPRSAGRTRPAGWPTRAGCRRRAGRCASR